MCVCVCMCVINTQLSKKMYTFSLNTNGHRSPLYTEIYIDILFEKYLTKLVDFLTLLMVTVLPFLEAGNEFRFCHPIVYGSESGFGVQYKMDDSGEVAFLPLEDHYFVL